MSGPAVTNDRRACTDRSPSAIRGGAPRLTGIHADRHSLNAGDMQRATKVPLVLGCGAPACLAAALLTRQRRRRAISRMTPVTRVGSKELLTAIDVHGVIESSVDFELRAIFNSFWAHEDNGP